MSLLKLTQRLMVTGPAVLLVAFAVNGRTPVAPNDAPQFGPVTHKRLLAYVLPILESQQIVSQGSNASLAELHRVANVWITGAREGRLQLVQPVDFDTPTGSTVLQEVRDVKTSVALALDYRSRREKGAAVRSQLALEAALVADVDKYTDFTAVRTYASIQARSMKTLLACLPELDGPHKNEAVRGLRALSPVTGRLQQLVQTVRSLHAAALARRGKAPLSIELSGSYERLAEAAGKDLAAGARELKDLTERSRLDSDLANLSTNLRLALQAEHDYSLSLEAAKRAFQSRRDRTPSLTSTE